MTARKDRKGRYHNTLDHTALSWSEAEELKAKLFGTHKPADDAAKEAMRRMAKHEDEPEA